MKKADELAKRYRAARRDLGLNGERQQDQLRKLQELFELTREELAEAIGLSLPALSSYLSPDDSPRHRKMPEADRLVIARILKSRGRKKKA